MESSDDGSIAPTRSRSAQQTEEQAKIVESQFRDTNMHNIQSKLPCTTLTTFNSFQSSSFIR